MSSPPDDASLDQSQPRLPDADAPDEAEPMVARAVDAPTRLADAPFPVTADQLRSYLAKLSTRSLVKRVIGAHVGPKTPRFLREDLFSDAITRFLEARDPPRSMETIDGWLAMLTARAVVDHFRRDATHLRWLRRDVEIEDQPAEPPESLDGDDAWLLTNWLGDQVKDDPKDRQIYEILLEKARTERTYDAIAADRKMTPAALANRIYRLRLKYLPVRVRHEQQRNRTFMWSILGGLALAIAALYAWSEFSRELAPPPASRAPAPRATIHVPAEPLPVPFFQAEPTGPEPGDKPGTK